MEQATRTPNEDQPVYDKWIFDNLEFHHWKPLKPLNMSLRTPRQTAIAVSKTIMETRKVIEKNPNLLEYECVNSAKYFTKKADKVIADFCMKFNTNEKHIRNVAGWVKPIEN